MSSFRQHMRPHRQHRNDAGCDLYCRTKAIINPGHTSIIGTGFYPTEEDIPPGTVGLVFARSSISHTNLIMHNSVGVIDSGYRGEVKVALRNVGDLRETVEVGDRIAQIVVLPLSALSSLYTDEPACNRGTGGFGSSGRK